MEEIKLSRVQRHQITYLVTTRTVVDMMIEDYHLDYNALRVKRRILSQIDGLLSGFPKYGMKALNQLNRITKIIWDKQKYSSIHPLTMLHLCLYSIEGVRFALREAGRRPSYYSDWTRLAGSLFTFIKHLDPGWEDPFDEHQVKAINIAEYFEEYI
jgi:hypothetical protein